MPAQNYRGIITLTLEQRAVLKRLAALISPIVGKPATYGEAVIEAERIVRIALADPVMREKVAS
jgi:hypothetical protein